MQGQIYRLIDAFSAQKRAVFTGDVHVSSFFSVAPLKESILEFNQVMISAWTVSKNAYGQILERLKIGIGQHGMSKLAIQRAPGVWRIVHQQQTTNKVTTIQLNVGGFV